MARLRTLYVGTKTVGDVREEQHILVLDGLTSDEMEGMVNYDRKEGIPPVLAFGYDVDLPSMDTDQTAPASGVTIDVTGTDEDLVRMIRRMVRMGDPDITRAVRRAAR